MTNCPGCGAENNEGAVYCKMCGINMNEPVQNNEGQPQQAPPPAVIYQPAYPPIYKPAPYTWKDICGTVGFISAIASFFVFWIFTCPVGLVGSILGFKSERTRGIAVAGVIISLISAVLKIGYILYTQVDLPRWLTSGIFG